MSQDYSRVNFSSARMARLSHWQNVFKWRAHTVIPQFCDPVYAWVMGMAAGLNRWPEVPTALWTAPPMPMLEPDKEGRAFTALVRSGAWTYPDLIRRMGNDPEAHVLEIEASNKRLDALDIVLDSDPRKVSIAGLYQPPQAPGEPDSGEQDDQPQTPTA